GLIRSRLRAISAYVYFPASTADKSFMSGIGLNRRPDGVSVTCNFIQSRIRYFFLSGPGIVTWPFLVTVVVRLAKRPISRDTISSSNIIFLILVVFFKTLGR